MSSKKPNDWLPLNIQKWRSKTRRLSHLERDCYMSLIMEYWERQGPLPMDHEELANVAVLSLDGWMDVQHKVLAYFYEKEGCLYHERLDEDINRANNITQRNRLNGAKGGRPKNPKRTQKEPSENLELTQAKPQKNTRACKGQLSVASKNVRLPLIDFEIENLISKTETEWFDCPYAKRARSKARANSYRGVS